MIQKLKFLKKPQIHREYIINHNHLEKLYNMYLHQTKYEKILDNLVFFAIVFTLSHFVAKLLFDIKDPLLSILFTISKLILLIFAADLLRHYVKAKSKRHFYTHHGVDVFLVVFLSFYFLFYTYLEMFRLTIIAVLKPLVSDIKYLRALIELFEDKKKEAQYEKYE